MEIDSCQSHALKRSPATRAACPTALPQTHPDIHNAHRCNRMLSHNEDDGQQTCLQQTSKALGPALRLLELMDSVDDRPPNRGYFREREFASCFPSEKMATRRESMLWGPPQ